MKKALIVVLLLVIAVGAASATPLFSKTYQQRQLVGEVTMTLYREQYTGRSSYIAQLEMEDGSGRPYVRAADAPHRAEMLVKFYACVPASKDFRGRTIRLFKEDYGCVKSEAQRKGKEPENIRVLAESKNGLMLEAWVSLDRVETVGLWFQIVGEKHEDSVSQMIVIPVTPVTIEEWIANPAGNCVSQLDSVPNLGNSIGPSLPLEQPQAQSGTITADQLFGSKTDGDVGPRPERPRDDRDDRDVRKDDRDDDEREDRDIRKDDRDDRKDSKPMKINHKVRGDVLVIKVVDRKGNRFYGTGSLLISAGGLTVERSFRDGKKLSAGKWCDFSGTIKITVDTCRDFTIDAIGFCDFEVKDDCITIFAY